MSQYNESAPDESEQLDQEEFHRTLESDADMADPLDQGVVPPDHWSAAEGFGNTVEEQREGETLEQRIAQEEPEPDPLVERPQTLDSDTTVEDEIDPDTDLLADDEVGEDRAGRLAATSGGEGMGVDDTEDELLATDVGIDNAGAGAEEAAVHVVEDDVVTLPDDPGV